MFRPITTRTQLAACATISALLISVLAFGVTHLAHRAATTTYCERCSLYAVALASTSESWLPSASEPEDQQLRHPLLSLGVVYVRLSTTEGLVLDIRRPEFAQARLPIPDPASVAAATTICFEGRLAVNVVFPHMIRSPIAEPADEEDLGTLQLGIDATELRQSNRRTTTIAATASFAAWILVTLSLVYMLEERKRRRSRQEAPVPGAMDAARRIVAGKLVLCLDQLRFEVDEIVIDLTPKQAAVLEMMMNRPGRAFSDADILAQVWQTSPYANSSDVKQQIYLIRKRLRDAGIEASKVLVTVPGVGYKLVTSQDDGAVDAVSTDKLGA